MLQTMRDNAQGTIAKIIVGFIIIVFALFGVESIVSLGGGEKPVAVVGDLEIFEVDVARTMAVQKQELERQFGDQFDANLFDEQFLRTSAIERLINQRVAIKQADALSLFASTEQIDQTIIATPAFQRNGEFDPEQFKYVLRTNALTPVGFRQQLADDLKVQQAQALVILSSFDSPFASQLDSSLAKEERVYKFKEFQTNNFLDTVSVSAEEIAVEYQANKQNLLSPEQVSLQYLELDRSDFSQDVDVTDIEVEDAYSAYVADVKSNELRQARHILIETNDQRTTDEAKAIAENVLAELQAGKEFTALVTEFSDDIGTKFNGGDLGFNAQGTLEAALDQAIFGLAEDEFSSIVETQFGLHIVQLLSIKGEPIKPLADVVDSLRAELIVQKATEEFATIQQELANLAFSASSVEEVAEAFNASVKTTETFSQTSVIDLANLGEIKRLAFQDNMKLDKEISPVISTESGALVFAVDQYIEPSVKPLAEVSDQLSARLERQKASAAASEAANAALESSDSSDWQEVTVSFEQASDSQRAIKEAAFAMATGQQQVVNVPGGFAVVELTKVSRNNWQDIELDNMEAGRVQGSRSDVVAYTAWGKSVTPIERD